MTDSNSKNNPSEPRWWNSPDSLNAAITKGNVPTGVRELGMQAALANAGIGVWDYNLITEEISFDKNMFVLYGLNPGEPVDSSDWIKRVHPADQEMVVRNFAEAARERTPLDHQFRLNLPQGGMRVYRSVGRVSMDSTTGHAHLCGVVIDITKEVNDFKQAHARNLKEIAVSKANALSKLSGGIAHEINNPLTIMLGHAENLLHGATQGFVPAADISRSASLIIQACQRISHIVRGLRNFARDGSQDAIETISLDSVLDHVLVLCRSRFRNQDIDLQIQMPPSELMISCRPVEMEQALFYVLSSLFDSTASHEERWIHVDTFEHEDFVEIALTCSGSNISDDIRKQIETRPSTAEIVGDGTNLGFGIAKQLIESARGKIQIRGSQPAKISIEVPKRPPEDAS